MSARSLEERFFSHVVKGAEPHHCWLWCGAIGDDGYGRFWVKDPVTGKGRVHRAHRFAMQLLISRELEAREYVLHRCDNPLCVKATEDNSTHVWLGDHSLNMVDRSERGRSNFQALRSGSKKERAQAARAVRDAVLAGGYDHEWVQRFVRELHKHQDTLF